MGEIKQGAYLIEGSIKHDIIAILQELFWTLGGGPGGFKKRIGIVVNKLGGYVDPDGIIRESFQ